MQTSHPHPISLLDWWPQFPRVGIKRYPEVFQSDPNYPVLADNVDNHPVFRVQLVMRMRFIRNIDADGLPAMRRCPACNNYTV